MTSNYPTYTLNIFPLKWRLNVGEMEHNYFLLHEYSIAFIAPPVSTSTLRDLDRMTTKNRNKRISPQQTCNSNWK